MYNCFSSCPNQSRIFHFCYQPLFSLGRDPTMICGNPLLYSIHEREHRMTQDLLYLYMIVMTSKCKHNNWPTGRPKKKVTVLEAAHSLVFNDRLFKFSGVVPDIIRFCYMTLFLMSDGWSLSYILSNENALIQKSAQIVDK